MKVKYIMLLNIVTVTNVKRVEFHIDHVEIITEDSDRKFITMIDRILEISEEN